MCKLYCHLIKLCMRKCIHYNFLSRIFVGVCYLRLDFESFDINGLSDSAEYKADADPKGVTACQDTFTITVSNFIYLRIFRKWIKLMQLLIYFWHIISLFSPHQIQVFLPFVEAMQASMVFQYYFLIPKYRMYLVM